MLLEHGADIHAPIRDAARWSTTWAAIDRPAAPSPTHRCEEVDAGRQHADAVCRPLRATSNRPELLVAKGANVNDTEADGNTALIVAAHSGHGTLAAFLLDQGADAKAAPLGYTALHAAVLRGTLRDRGVKNDDPGAGVPSFERCSRTAPIPTRASRRGRPSGAGATISRSSSAGSARRRCGSPRDFSSST